DHRDGLVKQFVWLCAPLRALGLCAVRRRPTTNDHRRGAEGAEGSPRGLVRHPLAPRAPECSVALRCPSPTDDERSPQRRRAPEQKRPSVRGWIVSAPAVTWPAGTAA